MPILFNPKSIALLAFFSSHEKDSLGLFCEDHGCDEIAETEGADPEVSI